MLVNHKDDYTRQFAYMLKLQNKTFNIMFFIGCQSKELFNAYTVWETTLPMLPPISELGVVLIGEIVVGGLVETVVLSSFEEIVVSSFDAIVVSSS